MQALSHQWLQMPALAQALPPSAPLLQIPLASPHTIVLQLTALLDPLGLVGLRHMPLHMGPAKPQPLQA